MPGVIGKICASGLFWMNAGSTVDAIREGGIPVADHDHPCPHLDRNDQRCAGHFRMGQLSELFEVCCAGFHGCTVFHRLNQEVAAASVPMRDKSFSSIELTINGSQQQLRPTGS